MKIEWRFWALVAAMVLAVVAMATCGCGLARPREEGSSNAAIPLHSSPSIEAAPSVRADDGAQVRQDIQNVQETLQGLVGKVEEVGSLVQNVETTMHDIGPMQQEIEQQRMDTYLQMVLVGVALFAGMLLIALAAPAIGGMLVTVFYVAGVTLIALPAVLLLLLAYLAG